MRADGTTRTKRYWYYTTNLSGSDDRAGIERLPADEVDRVVLNCLKDHLSDPRWLADQVKEQKGGVNLLANLVGANGVKGSDTDGAEDAPAQQNRRGTIERVDATSNRLWVSVNLAALLEEKDIQDPIPATLEIPFEKRQNGRAKPIVIAPENTSEPDPDLVALVADARRWAGELLDGSASSIRHITEREGLRSGVVSRILPLAWLAPDISSAILEGRQPSNLSAKSLRELPELPLEWSKRREILGFPCR